MSDLKNILQWMKADIQVLQVYSLDNGRDIHLGQLNYFKNKKFSEFQYSDEALDLKEEWSPFVLPLSKDVYRTSERLPPYFQGLNGLFADSLPDGWGTRLMDIAFTRLGLNSTDITPAVRLAFLGNRTMGSLGYTPTMTSSFSSDKGQLNLEKVILDIESMEYTSVNDIPKNILVGGSSAGGVHPKILSSVSEDWARIEPYRFENKKSKLTPWLIKFRDKADPKDLLKVEYVYSLIAQSLGIQMSPCKLLTIGDKNAFATKRFDVDANGNRLFVHSLTGLLEKTPSSSDLDYGHIATILKYFKVSQVEMEEAFKRSVFNVVMINRDDHGKNFAFMKDDKNGWHSSPAYDLVYMEGIMNSHALKIAGYSGKIPSYTDLMRLGRVFMLTESKAKKIISEVLDASSQLKYLLELHCVHEDLAFWIVESVKDNADSIKKQMNTFKTIKVKPLG